MTFYIEQFIKDRNKPIVVEKTDPALKAIRLMQENDFTQIPVVDDENEPIGMLTNESLIRGAINFGVNLKELSVSDVIQQVKKFQVDEDIFDLLNELKTSFAVLVVDAEGKLLDIFTSYDALEFFRQRFDDFMMVEDIEGMIKDLILNSFTDNEGNINSQNMEALSEQIKRYDFQKNTLQSGLCKAVASYLQSINLKKKIQFDLIEKIIEDEIANEKDMKFSDLGYDHYSRILLSDNVWNNYENVISMKRDGVRKILNDARDSRNILAHFKGELTQQQRRQLVFCKDWLNQQIEAIQSVELPEEEIITVSNELSPSEEDEGKIGGKYTPFFDWLNVIPKEKDRVTINFNKFEDIIGEDLPVSAREHRAWWANDSVAHSHSILWLEAGWRTTYINLTEQRVTLARIAEREKAYINFFNMQLEELRIINNFPLEEFNPGGQSWQTVFSVQSDGRRVATYSFAFARGSKYRVEIYIDSGNQEVNKRIFDLMNQDKAEIERSFGDSLSWERISNKRASRIAFYQSGRITQGQSELTHLAEESAKIMSDFYKSTIEKLKIGYDQLN